MEDCEMTESLERYYSASLTRGRANNPTISEARRDLQCDWFQLVASGGIMRL